MKAQQYGQQQAPSDNQVRIVGRLSDVAQERALPSGDTVWTFRLIVSRPEQDRRGSRATVDVVPCTVWRGRLRGRVGGWQPDDVVEIRGALRRRFFRAGGAAASVIEVEASGGKVIRRAASA